MKKHWPVLVLSLILALLAFWPRLEYQRKLETDHQFITKSFSNDDLYYMARARDVLDGHYLVASPFFAEHKNGQPFQVWLPEWLLTRPLTWFGIDVVSGYNYYIIIFVFIITILTYLTVHAFLNSRTYSIFAVNWLIGFLFFWLFSRIPSPAFNFIFWLSLMTELIYYLKTRKVFWLFLSAINLGLLFYLYPYYWTFAFVWVTIFVVLSKILIAEFKARNWLLVMAGAAVIGFRYFWELWKSSRLPAYEDTITRLGLLNTHFPSGLKIVFWGALVLLFLAVLWKKKIIPRNTSTVLLLSGVLSSIIVVNQHVITGKNQEFSSHYWMPAAFIFVFGFLYCTKFLLEKLIQHNLLNRLLLVSGFVIVALNLIILFKQGNVLAAVTQADIERQDYAIIFDWLNHHTAKDEVVYANSELSLYIPVYTANNVYYSRHGTLFFISDEEIQERFAISRYFDTFDRDDVLASESSIWNTRYINSYAHKQSKNKLRRFFGMETVKYTKIPEAEILRFENLLESVQQTDFFEVLNRYEVDYLVKDKYYDLNWDLSSYDFLSKEFENSRFVIYEIYN